MSVVTQQQYVARAGFCELKIVHYDFEIFGALSLMTGLGSLTAQQGC